MAKFKPYKILESQLDSLPIREGQFILTTDTKKLYSDTAANTRILISPDAITDLSVNGTTITYTRLDGTTGTITTKDTTYSVASETKNGLMSSDDKAKLNAIESGAQKNTVTGIKGDSETLYRTGNVNITKSNIGLSNVENKSSATIRGELTSSNVTTALGYTPLNSNLKGANNGLAELDASGKVPTSQLPSYVDDVLEYSSRSIFPSPGEAGKIYVDASTNRTYRWGGSAYVEISQSLALGTTSSTAFRGDYGNTAYQHANKKGSEFYSGFYKIGTNAEGHVTSATSVTKEDITALGIPAQDTTYGTATSSVDGLMSSDDKNKLLNIEAYAQKNKVHGVKGSAETEYRTGNINITKANIGLGNVENKSSATIRSELTQAEVANALGYLPPRTDTNTTYEEATPSTGGLMSAADKHKMDSIERGAQVNTITGVKGSAESTYRTGNVSITKANIGLGNVDNTADADKSVKSAGQLATARKINGVAFNGTKDITVTANPTTTTLTNEDLNDIKTPGLYNTGGGNVTTNKPSGVDSYGLFVYKTASGYITQELTGGNSNPMLRYIRQFNNSTWSAWTQMKFTDTNTTYTFATGDANGQIKVTPSGGSAQNVSVKGLAAAAYKGVDTSMTKTSTSTNVPTTKAVADLITAEMADISVDGVITSSNETVENIVSLTKAEYEALTEKEVNTLYHITDDIGENDLSVADAVPTGARIGYNGTEAPEGYEVISTSKNVSDNLPVGSGMDYFGTTAPYGYLFADGSAISRTEYAELFAIIGTTYGAGDGSTTFNLPDKRSRVSVMKDSGTFNELGKKGGEETHQLTEAELPEVSGAASGVATYQSWATGNFTATKEGTGELSGSAGARHWTSLLFKFGQNKAHNNLQPYLVCNYIIKVKNTSTYDTFMFDLGGAY